MERKEFNSLNEAALHVQQGTTPEPEVNDMVLEYFENYFGGSLNESVSDEDIMEAVYDLIDLTDAVCEATGLSKQTLKRYITRAAGSMATERSAGDWLDAEGYGSDNKKQIKRARKKERNRTVGIGKAVNRLSEK